MESASRQTAYQMDIHDNVATALTDIKAGAVSLLGNVNGNAVLACENISKGHKIALRNIKSGDDIIKYNVVIGKATKDITCGSWVHLHCIKSLYDERSSHLDVYTGAPKDIAYE